MIRRLPIGALLGGMPWIFPYHQVARFSAPNLMLGNTIILTDPGLPQGAITGAVAKSGGGVTNARV
jgi:acyl-CoA reductase-like NAD-dependent aldehyde dehydrogenase